MKRTMLIAVVAAAVLGGWGSAAQADKADLAKKRDALTAEYGLAKEANFYFVFDILGRELELRVRGMVLKSWPVRSMRFWGRPDFAGTVELVRKTTLKSPERIVIKPGGTEEAAPAPPAKPAAAGTAATSADYDLEALELRDMPKRFSLDFDNGLHVTVKAKSGTERGVGAKMNDAWRWYIGLPLKELTGSKRAAGLAELELVLEKEEDAQAVYWHFFDGIKGIVQ